MVNQSSIPIVKSNTLIETSYQLGVREQFFVLFLISQISQADLNFKEYQMHYSDIVRILNFDGRRRIANKRDVFKLMNNLNKQPIRFTKGDEDIQVVWISKLKHNKKSNTFTFAFSDELKGYLLQLKQHFTKYNIHNIVYLTRHSIRIYELLKRHQFRGKVILSVEQLKFFLGVMDKYDEFYEFKRWILLPSQKELKKYTDIQFTFKGHEKEGKKIISLLFNIYENDPEQIPKELSVLTDLDLDNVKVSRQPKNSKITGKETIKVLTYFQTEAYHFLVEKGVNKTFVLKNILPHPKVRYEVLQGFEDIYFKIVWAYFKKKTKAKKLAGAFVSWWKNERLQKDSLHAKHLESVQDRKKQMSVQERDNRQVSKEMTTTDYEKYLQQYFIQDAAVESENIQLSNIPTFNFDKTIFSNAFNFEQFKKKHSAQYMSFMDSVINDYRKTFAEVDQVFDFNKYAQAIEAKVKVLCEEWMKEQ